ncbi:MAG: M13 family metallopeptidase, partial [Lachnospiraceae bacterium]|nr:M13 family metallopeptidase [Lachnospiraceae bacterium]
FQAMDTVKERCLEFLNDKTLKFDDPVLSHDISLIQNYFNLFLDWDERNAIGAEPVKSLVEKIQSISTLDEMTEFLLSNDAFDDSIGLFNILVHTAKEDSSLYEVVISPTDLPLGDSAEYSSLTENGKRIKQANDDKTTYMLKRIGFDDESIKSLLDLSHNFAGKVAKNIMSILESNNSDSLLKTINQVTMDDIKKIEGKLPLSAFMEKYGYASSKLINLNEPKWLDALKDIYADENLDGMKAYFLTYVARIYINRVDEEAFRKNQEINNVLRGINESMSDVDLAYQETRLLLPYCFDRIYLNKYVTAEMKNEITSLCKESIDAYRDMLSSIDWLSEETKKAAIKKLDNINIHSLYPDKWEDDSIYQIKSKENGGTYIDAQKAITKGIIKRQLSYINQKVDKDIWGIDILDTNAYYNPEDNSINIIPGFFCDVTYRSDMSLEEKYGAIGSVIGHEISHAFDTIGSQYDELGNVKNWWAKEDKEAFRNRANKLIEYYDKVVAFDDGTKYSGQMVQTEAIADMAGIKCMLMLAKRVPNFDYDKFFRANARLWARVNTLQVSEALVLTDTHPIEYLRANVTLQQYDEFIETYDIKEGDGMYIAPENRIAVW